MQRIFKNVFTLYSIYVLSHQNSWQILIIWKISIVKTQYVGTKIIWCPIWYTKLSFASGEWELTFDSEMVQIHRITLIPLSATKICLQSGGLKWNIKQSYKCQESLWKKPVPCVSHSLTFFAEVLLQMEIASSALVHNKCWAVGSLFLWAMCLLHFISTSQQRARQEVFFPLPCWVHVC